MDQVTGQNTELEWNWSDLKWWQSGEWQVVEERLDDLDRAGIIYNPERKSLFRALELTPFQRCKVLICGQDPYPEAKFATGVAFSIPQSLRKYPPTLKIIYDELLEDLHFERKNGSLESLCSQGVLLWNAIPSCLTGHSMSHDWTEYEFLSSEIVKELAKKGIVFAFLGGVARRYAKYVTPENNMVIETSHPSPRANRVARHPFSGSRLFSTINGYLTELGHSPVDWRL